jgi:single-strand DNA-binding protein
VLKLWPARTDPSARCKPFVSKVSKSLSRRCGPPNPPPRTSTHNLEMRSLASEKNVTTFTVASNEFLGGGKEKAEYHPVVAWDRLAEIAGRYLGKGQQVAIEGRLQTRSWDDEKGARHWKTEIVASHVEMLSGRRKKDYEAQQAADSLAAQAVALGEAPASEPIAQASFDPGTSDDDDDDDIEAEEETTAAVA